VAAPGGSRQGLRGLAGPCGASALHGGSPLLRPVLRHILLVYLLAFRGSRWLCRGRRLRRSRRLRGGRRCRRSRRLRGCARRDRCGCGGAGRDRRLRGGAGRDRRGYARRRRKPRQGGAAAAAHDIVARVRRFAFRAYRFFFFCGWWPETHRFTIPFLLLSRPCSQDRDGAWLSLSWAWLARGTRLGPVAPLGPWCRRVGPC
jgi:hypothetical protein